MGIGRVAGPVSASPLRGAATAAWHDVARLAEEVDWDRVLPPRATSMAWRIEQSVKRALDLGGACLGLVVLSPLLLAIAIIVAAESGSPVLYEWRVVGRRGRPFVGYKFRTMVKDADRLKVDLEHRNEMSGPVFKIRDDPRVTPVGRWLRRFSFDELPQLWSVLRGHMSLVGPRPLFPHEFAMCSAAQRAKLAVTPGMTCLWQASGRSSISDFEEWVALDFAYIRDWSLWLDLRILARTALAVVSGRGAH
ncbi:MAG: sugar transferase [Candidatus Binatia bacterium]